MNNNFITHANESDSELKNVGIGVFQITKNIVQDLFCSIKQGMTKIDTLRQVRINKQQQVYRYSIGRMNNLKKLQMGLYRD